MDTLQELFDEAVDKQSQAKYEGKASGFIDGMVGFACVGILIVGASFFAIRSPQEFTAIRELILHISCFVAIVGFIFISIFLYDTFYVHEDTVSLEKIKNEGIREITATEYSTSYYRNARGGIGFSIMGFAISFYVPWYLLVEAFGAGITLFSVYRVLYIILSVFAIILVKRIERKGGYSKPWYREERTRPRL